jgi:hypothetical protein
MYRVSDRCCVYPIVLAVAPDEPDVNDSHCVADRDDQPVIVPLDIEHDAIVPYKAGIPVNRLDIAGSTPLRALYIVEPRSKRLLGISMFTPEISQRPTGDDAHEEA